MILSEVGTRPVFVMNSSTGTGLSQLWLSTSLKLVLPMSQDFLLPLSVNSLLLV